MTEQMKIEDLDTLAIEGDLVRDYLTEALENTEVLQELFTNYLVDTDNSNLSAQIIDILDSIKDGASLIGLDMILRLSHELNIIFRKIKDGKLTLESDAQEVMTLSLDILSEIIRSRLNGTELEMDFDEVLDGVKLLHQAKTAENNGENREMSSTEKKRFDFFKEAVNQQLITIEETLTSLGKNYSRNSLLQLIRGLQGIRGASSFIEHEEMKIRAEAIEEELDRLLADENSTALPAVLDEITAFTAGVKKYISAQEKRGVRPDSQTAGKAKGRVTEENLRINIAKIDSLMNGIEELMTLNTKLLNIKDRISSDPSLNRHVNEVGSLATFFDKITEQLYKQMLNVRMLAVSNLFDKFINVISTLSEEQNKEIQINVSGEDTEIDRVVLESLKDPLIHLIRNAVDHGIEKAGERIAQGKPGRGQVNLRAFNDVNSVVIEIEDDGKGMDYIRIRNKAVEKGLISEEEALALDKHECLDFIFKPGFSTADKITDISGRGVGMDVVRTSVEKHNGTIHIITDKGQGTCFVIRLPLAMSMVDTLVVECDSSNFAIPSDGIERILKVPRGILKTIYNKTVLPVKGNTLPYKRLSDIYELSVSKDTSDKPYTLTAIVKGASGRIALGIDRILGKQKVVIKNIGKYLKNIKGISGAFIQGDGTIILVVDIQEICRLGA